MGLPMLAKVMLAPNPNRNDQIDRVLIIEESLDKQTVRVLNVDALNKNPALMKPYGGSYAAATNTWKAVSVILLLGGIVLAMVWHWWLFILGLILAWIIARHNKQDAAEFAQEIITKYPRAIDEFAKQGLVWELPAVKVVPS